MMCQVQVKPAPRESAPGWLEPRPIPRGNVLSNMGTTITHPFGNGLYHLFYGDVGDGVLLFYPHFFFGGDPLIPLVQHPFQIELLLWTESVPHGTRGANAHGYC